MGGTLSSVKGGNGSVGGRFLVVLYSVLFNCRQGTVEPRQYDFQGTTGKCRMKGVQVNAALVDGLAQQVG